MADSGTWSINVTRQIGEQIRAARKRAGLTSEQLANACTEIGLPMKQPVVANLEAGRRNTVSAPELLAIAWVLDVPPVTLLGPLSQPASPVHAPGPALSPAVNLVEWAAGMDPVIADGSLEREDGMEGARSVLAKLRDLRETAHALTVQADQWKRYPPTNVRQTRSAVEPLGSLVERLAGTLNSLERLGVEISGSDLALPDLAPVFKHLDPWTVNELQELDSAVDWRARIESLRESWTAIEEAS